MKGTFMLYIDQYGRRWGAKTLRGLKKQVGSGKVSKMYCDTKDGTIYHTGYVIGQLWLTAYVPYKGEV
jgi:hypothetical protein